VVDRTRRSSGTATGGLFGAAFDAPFNI